MVGCLLLTMSHNQTYGGKWYQKINRLLVCKFLAFLPLPDMDAIRNSSWMNYRGSWVGVKCVSCCSGGISSYYPNVLPQNNFRRKALLWTVYTESYFLPSKWFPWKQLTVCYWCNLEKRKISFWQDVTVVCCCCCCYVIFLLYEGPKN